MISQNNAYAPVHYDNRRYYPIPEIGEDVQFPSVTTILDALIAKPGLRQWMANITAEYAKEELIEKLRSGDLTLEDVQLMDTKQFVREAKMAHKAKSEEAKDIGLRVHDFCNTLFRRLIELPSQTLKLDCDKDILEPCSAVVEWIHTNDVRPVELESRIWSEDFGGYGGRLDLVAFVNKKFLTLEIKTAKDIYDEYTLQTAAYDHGFEERNKGQYTDGIAILRLDKEKGFPEFYEYTKEQRDDFLEEFGYWCTIWHLRNDRTKREREEKKKERERLKELRKDLPKKPRKKLKEDPIP